MFCPWVTKNSWMYMKIKNGKWKLCIKLPHVRFYCKDESFVSSNFLIPKERWTYQMITQIAKLEWGGTFGAIEVLKSTDYHLPSLQQK